jgi:hypothetical protein
LLSPLATANDAVIVCTPAVVNVVVSEAVANASATAPLFANETGTTVFVQEAAVPQAEKVTEPVGPAPLLDWAHAEGLARTAQPPTVAKSVTDWPVLTVTVEAPLAVTEVSVAAGVIVIARAGAVLAL